MKKIFSLAVAVTLSTVWDGVGIVAAAPGSSSAGPNQQVMAPTHPKPHMVHRTHHHASSNSAQRAKTERHTQPHATAHRHSHGASGAQSTAPVAPSQATQQ